MDDADRAALDDDLHQARALAAAYQYAAHVVRSRPAARDRDGHRLCLGCGEPLSAARLHAWPTAVRCVDCQALLERRG